MRQENIDKINVIKGGLDTLRPILQMCGVVKYPTVDEILDMAAKQTADEDQQVMFLKGYLKGTGMVMGNLGSITRTQSRTNQATNKGFLARLLNF